MVKQVGRPGKHKSAAITFRTDERDNLYRMINKYRTSPFTGKCYFDNVSFVKDKKTGLYHIILTENQVKEFGIHEDFAVPEGKHQLMFMIRPTDIDRDFIVFRKKDLDA